MLSTYRPALDTPPEAPAPQPPRELDLFALLLLLLRHLRLILVCAVVTALLVVAWSLLVKPRFAATVVMILPQHSASGGGASLAAQLALGAGGGDIFGSGYEQYADMLTSRAVADQIIHDFDLTRVYHAKDLEQAETILAGVTTVVTQREGLIRVTVQDANAGRAADMANDYQRQLEALNSHLVVTSAGQKRAYLERELVQEKDALADAEVALKQVAESGSGLPPEAQANAALSAIESTRLQLRAAQVRLDALLTSETDANPDVVRARSEVSTLSGQLQALTAGAPSTTVGTPTQQVPERTLVYTRRLRDVKFHEGLFDLIERQFEDAKQQESRTPSIVQVLDPAIPASHKSWPPRTRYCVLAFFAGLLLGIVFVLLRALVLAFTTAPHNSEKLAQLRALYRNPLGR